MSPSPTAWMRALADPNVEKFLFIGDRTAAIGGIMASIVGKTPRSAPDAELLTFKIVQSAEEALAWFKGQTGCAETTTVYRRTIQ